MPFYEYQCKSCGHDSRGHAEDQRTALKKCPHCGKSQLQRLMSAPVFRLKGGGWYETDFKGDQDNKRNLADRPDADAPKDSGKEGAKDARPRTAPTPRSAEGKAGDAKAAESGAAKDAPKPADKAADKTLGQGSAQVRQEA